MCITEEIAKILEDKVKNTQHDQLHPVVVSRGYILISEGGLVTNKKAIKAIRQQH